MAGKQNKGENIQIDTDLQEIRTHPLINQEVKKNARKYVTGPHNRTQKEIQQAIAPKKNQARGDDGIPGESIGMLQKWILTPSIQIMNKIKAAKDVPTGWKHGTAAHIYTARR